VLVAKRLAITDPPGGGAGRSRELVTDAAKALHVADPVGYRHTMNPARRDDAETPAAQRPLIHGMRAKLHLAGVALLVLGAGRAVAPRRPAPAAEEKVAPILEAAVDRRDPARLFRPLQDAGRAALPYTVSFWSRGHSAFDTHPDFESAVEERMPSAFGVLLANDQVITHVLALDGRMEARVTLADGAEVLARVRAYEARTGLVRLQLTTGLAGAPTAPLASTRPVAGALTVAAARFEGRDLLVPVFVGAVGPDSYRLEPVGGPLRPGTPIYNLDGEAIGIAAGEGPIAYSLAGVLDRLDAMAREAPGFPRSIGVCLQTITPSIAKRIGDGGVLVSDVQEDGPAARAGVGPGDVVIRVAGEPTPTLAAARQRIASARAGQRIMVTVRREGRSRELEVTVEETLARGSCDGAKPLPAAALRVGSVLTAPELSRAGLSPDAFVLSVDGVSIGQRSAQAALRRGENARLLHVQERTRRYFAVVGGEE
jgi:S1-C subfamily serine protease